MEAIEHLGQVQDVTFGHTADVMAAHLPHVFGVEHRGRGMADARAVHEHILRTRPKVVVMETSAEEVPRARATDLRRVDHVAPETWAYEAALACGARVVHADRPKRITYARLLHGCDVEELDEAYAEEAVRNYRKILAGKHKQVWHKKRKDAFQRVVVEERDAGMARALANVLEKHGAKDVVAVVGRRHRYGIRKHLVQRCRRSKGQIVPGSMLEEHLDWTVDVPEDQDWRKQHPAAYGVKRALFERVLAMATDPSVLQDARQWMGPMEPDEAHAHALAEEVYGAPRMMLACVPPELRECVVCARRGQEKSFAHAIEELGRVRPSQKGSGYSDHALEMLRGLHFQIQ